jgi:hypothetical protein
MSLPPKLERELIELRQAIQVEIVEDYDLINLIVRDFPTGGAFNLSHCDLLLRIPRSYPDSGPDMFWTNHELVLTNGTCPHCASAIEDYLGQRWRRFSWHWNSWNSPRDNLHGYLEFVRQCLKRQV